MSVTEIKIIARERGLKVGKHRKPEIIRLIQRSEGNFDCFGTATDGYCDQEACLWRTDCLKGF